MNILDMWQEGDGQQDVRFFERGVEVVLLELLADERLKDSQFYAFKEYKNANGDRICGSCRRICLFSNCPVNSGSGQGADLHRAVYRRHLHQPIQARDSHPSHVQ